MKILIQCNLPFALAHGGQQVQIEQTLSALQAIGLEAEPLRWWDDGQRGDVIHYFGRMPAEQIGLAHEKGIKVVMAELLTVTGSRSPAQLRFQKIISRTIAGIAPPTFIASFNWESYHLADAVIALTPWEKHLMEYLFGADGRKTHVVANGVEDVFFATRPLKRGPWLVCTATITERKRVLELAGAAVQARTPVWMIGRPYASGDPYSEKLFALAKQHPEIIRYQGEIQDRGRLAQIYREARGFVLLSARESMSLSALEAAACECPLLLSDLPWARSTFGQGAQYCPLSQSVETTAQALRRFYDEAPALPLPLKPPTWKEIACQLKRIYEEVLNAPAEHSPKKFVP